YEAAFARYRDSTESIVAELDGLSAPPVLRPSLLAELRTLRRTSRLSGSVAAALHGRDVVAANKGIRQLFATAATANQASTRQAAAAAVRAYNGRLREIATLSAKVVQER